MSANPKSKIIQVLNPKPSWPLHKKIATKRSKIQEFEFWILDWIRIRDFGFWGGSTRITTRQLGDGDVWWFPTISHVKIWNHPFETTIKTTCCLGYPVVVSSVWAIDQLHIGRRCWGFGPALLDFADGQVQVKTKWCGLFPLFSTGDVIIPTKFPLMSDGHKMKSVINSSSRMVNVARRIWPHAAESLLSNVKVMGLSWFSILWSNKALLSVFSKML